jgi:hypothetical protein
MMLMSGLAGSKQASAGNTIEEDEEEEANEDEEDESQARRSSNCKQRNTSKKHPQPFKVIKTPIAAPTPRCPRCHKHLK